jgi:hypothetical protein
MQTPMVWGAFAGFLRLQGAHRGLQIPELSVAMKKDGAPPLLCSCTVHLRHQRKAYSEHRSSEPFKYRSDGSYTIPLQNSGDFASCKFKYVP